MSRTGELEDTMGGLSVVDSQIMASNGLLYKMPQELSTTMDRTFVKEFAQAQLYAQGTTVTWDLNTGASYPDPDNAMLSFILAVTANTGPDAADRYTFGSSLATNLISEIRLISKNGVELDRIQNANVLSKVMVDYMYSDEGQGMLEMAGKNIAPTAMGGLGVRYVIPMNLISGFFRPEVKGMKIPSGLASGLRIEMTLEAPNRALVQTAGTGTDISYTVSTPVIYMMTHKLNDPTSAVLMQNSAQTGLEYTFPSYFNSPQSTTSLAVVEQVGKAVAKATSVFTSIYDSATKIDITADSFRSIISAELADYQYRVGNNYYPQQVVKDNVESWYIAESAFNKTRDWRTTPSFIRKADYDAGGKFLVASSLETDGNLNLSGVPLNNSNTLELRMTVTNAVTADKTFHTFLRYTTVARTFVNKTSIKI